jgi:hypothetical protein
VSGHCEICNEDIDPGGLREMVDHIRLLHPDDYEEPEQWPDGGFVIHEEPSDLNEAWEGEQ